MRALDQTPEFRRCLQEAGIPLGSRVALEENAPQGGACALRTETGQRLLLGRAAASPTAEIPNFLKRFSQAKTVPRHRLAAFPLADRGGGR